MFHIFVQTSVIISDAAAPELESVSAVNTMAGEIADASIVIIQRLGKLFREVLIAIW